jgi:hypothetical protein
MPITTRDHIHLWKAGTTFVHDTTRYGVSFPDGYRPKDNVLMTVEGSVTGARHVHRLVDGEGQVKHFRDGDYRLLVTNTERDQLTPLKGELCYFMPLDHMGDGESHVDGSNVALTPGYLVVVMNYPSEVAIDPGHTYWLVGVPIMEKT